MLNKDDAIQVCASRCTLFSWFSQAQNACSGIFGLIKSFANKSSQKEHKSKHVLRNEPQRGQRHRPSWREDGNRHAARLRCWDPAPHGHGAQPKARHVPQTRGLQGKLLPAHASQSRRFSVTQSTLCEVRPPPRQNASTALCRATPGTAGPQAPSAPR